jgi:hypothetical protein
MKKSIVLAVVAFAGINSVSTSAVNLKSGVKKSYYDEQDRRDQEEYEYLKRKK